MKAFIVFATLVAASSAAWVFLPLPGAGNRPEILPPSIDPIHPSLPEVDPVHPSVPEVDPIHPERPLPPGISPEVPIVPPKPELPKPTPPFVPPTVHSEILNFPSDDDPQIRVHVNIKDGNFPMHRVARSILNWPGLVWPGLKPNVPEAGNKPSLPEIGNKPSPPEIGNKPSPPEIGNKPEIPGGNLPEIMPPPEISFPTPEVNPPTTDVHTYIYPNVQHQLVKLRVQYNKPAEAIDLPAPEWAPYKLEFPGFGNKPALPEAGHKPELPVEPPSKLFFFLQTFFFSKTSYSSQLAWRSWREPNHSNANSTNWTKNSPS